MCSIHLLRCAFIRNFMHDLSMKYSVTQHYILMLCIHYALMFIAICPQYVAVFRSDYVLDLFLFLVPTIPPPPPPSGGIGPSITMLTLSANGGSANSQIPITISVTVGVGVGSISIIIIAVCLMRLGRKGLLSKQSGQRCFTSIMALLTLHTPHTHCPNIVVTTVVIAMNMTARL